jgi:hypothetical protein
MQGANPCVALVFTSSLISGQKTHRSAPASEITPEAEQTTKVQEAILLLLAL